MPHYYFHNRTDIALAEDPDGTELATLKAARAEAVIDLRQLAAAAIRQSLPVGNRHIDICDAAGQLLMTVSARGALRPLLP
jgi:hypothetical protein